MSDALLVTYKDVEIYLLSRVQDILPARNSRIASISRRIIEVALIAFRIRGGAPRHAERGKREASDRFWYANRLTVIPFILNCLSISPETHGKCALTRLLINSAHLSNRYQCPLHRRCRSDPERRLSRTRGENRVRTLREEEHLRRRVSARFLPDYNCIPPKMRQLEMASSTFARLLH